MLLAAAALVQKINITVWQFKKNRWLKIAVLRAGDGWEQSPVIPLILCRGHFMTRRLQKQPWSKEWTMDIEEEMACSHTVDTPWSA